MDTNEIKQVLIEQLNLDKVIVKRDGDGNNFNIIAVSDVFKGMSRVKQQQLIYEPLMDYILSHKIHALSIKAYTLAEWIERERVV